MPAPTRPPLGPVFAGGCAGVLLRAVLTEGVDPAAGTWPWPTFAVNVAGALLLGWLVARPPADNRVRAGWGAGFCGALTTFSTLQIEVIELADHGHATLAALYGAASLLAGVAAVALGRRGSTA